MGVYRKKIMSASLALFCLLFVSTAQAAISLVLDSPHGMQGSQIEVAIHASTDTPLAGFNLEIILPTGISINNVSPGDLLLGSGSYQLSHQVDGQKLRVICWSNTTSFNGSGEILKLNLQLDTAPLGLQGLIFAVINSDPLVNSRHAVSNIDGSESLAHDVLNDTFLVFSQDSDFDADGLPDAWEVGFGLDPLANNSDADFDDDGFTDAQEFEAGTDPTDPLSKPECFGDDYIFCDGFEDMAP
jgi:hypothetical protein